MVVVVVQDKGGGDKIRVSVRYIETNNIINKGLVFFFPFLKPFPFPLCKPNAP